MRAQELLSIGNTGENWFSFNHEISPATPNIMMIKIWTTIMVLILPYFCLLLMVFKCQAQLVCPKRDEAFELVTGYVFTSPDTILDTRPGVLKLEDCIETCRRNSSCWSVNYETGLCVLFSSSAENTPGKPISVLLTLMINGPGTPFVLILSRNRKFNIISRNNAF